MSSAEETNTSQLPAAQFPNLFAFFSNFLSFMWGEKIEKEGSYEEENERLKVYIGFIAKNIWRCSYWRVNVGLFVPPSLITQNYSSDIDTLSEFN